MQKQKSSSVKTSAGQVKVKTCPVKLNSYFTGIIFTTIILLNFLGMVKNSEAAINSVSGIFSNGNNITINGNGFGTKAHAEPLIFDNFDSGQVSTKWGEIENGIEMYNGSGQLPNSNYCLRMDKSQDSSFDIRFDHIMNPGGDKLYVFVKRRYDYDISPDNNKIFRIWNTVRPGSISWSIVNGDSLIYRSSIDPFVDPNNPLPGVYGNFNSSDCPQIGQWKLDEFFVKTETSIGAYDGVMGYRLNNNQERSWAENRIMFNSDWNQFEQIFIDNFSNHPTGGPTGDYIYVDDVYIDDTWARVVIGDSSEYDACDHLEIQIPTSWSEDSITITANQGSFNVGDTAYLFVVDEDENVSNGYQITINDEFDTTPPSAPSGLEVS